MSQRSLLTRLLSCFEGPSPRSPDTSPGVVDAASTVYMDAAALLHDHLTKRDGQLGPEHLSQEFGSLGNGLAESAKTTSVANGEQNKKKNRYTNVLPFDYNRVKLKEVDPETDYINASLVAWNSTAVTGVPGEVPCKYVATQGPLNCTISDFWTMIIQNGLTSIVMLTRTMECRSQRCAQYFPEEPGATVEHGNHTITTLSLQELNADISMRQLMVTRKPSNGNQAEPEQHFITHYHYHLWPDHGVPSSVTPLRELSYNLWQQGCKSVAVHCSAGIGRTGTFIAADSLLRRMWALAGSGRRVDKATLKRALDVPSVVCELRMMRSGMVQTAEQYGLLYEIVLNEALARSDALAKAANPPNPSVHTQKRGRALSTSVQPSAAVSTAQPRRWSQAQVTDAGSNSSLARSHTGTPRTSLSLGLEALQGAGSEQSENISSSRLPSTTLQDWDTSRAGREKRSLSRLPSATLQGWDASQPGLDTRNIARLPSASLQGWESQIMRLASQSAPRPKSVLERERRQSFERGKAAVAGATSPNAQEKAAAVVRQQSGGNTSGGLSRMNSWQLQQTNAPWGA